MKSLCILILLCFDLFAAKCKYEACTSESISGQMQVNMNTVQANKTVIDKLNELKKVLEKEKSTSDMNINKHKELLTVQKTKQLQLNEILFFVEQKNQLIFTK